MTDAQERGANMRKARINAGLTVLKLANRAGITHSSISMSEHGRRNPSLGTVILLADVLGISIDEYVGHKPKGGHDD